MASQPPPAKRRRLDVSAPLLAAGVDDASAVRDGFDRASGQWSWRPVEPECDERCSVAPSPSPSVGDVGPRLRKRRRGGSPERAAPLAGMLVATEPVGKRWQAWLVKLEGPRSRAARRRRPPLFVVGVAREGLDRGRFLAGGALDTAHWDPDQVDPTFEFDFCGSGSPEAGIALTRLGAQEASRMTRDHYLHCSPWYRRTFGRDCRASTAFEGRELLVVADGWHRNLLIFVQGMDCGPSDVHPRPARGRRLTGEPWQRPIRINGDFRLAVVLGRSCRASIRQVPARWLEHFQGMLSPPPLPPPRPAGSVGQAQSVPDLDVRAPRAARRPHALSADAACGAQVVQHWRWPAARLTGFPPGRLGRRPAGQWWTEYTTQRRGGSLMQQLVSDGFHRAEGTQGLCRLLLDRGRLPKERKAFVRSCAAWWTFGMRTRGCCARLAAPRPMARRGRGKASPDPERRFRERLCAEEVAGFVAAGFEKHREWRVVGTEAVGADGGGVLDSRALERMLSTNPPLLGAASGQAGPHPRARAFYDMALEIFRGVHEVHSTLERRLDRQVEFRIGGSSALPCVEARDLIRWPDIVHALSAQLRFPPLDVEVSFRLLPPDRLAGAGCVPPDLVPHAAPPVFGLLDNGGDEEHAQPPHFQRWKLRSEQLRSLGWMVRREEEPAPLVVEFRSHTRGRNHYLQSSSSLVYWGGVTDVRLRATYGVRGGILGDAIGYGKTATTIGLVDVRREAPAPPVPGCEEGRFFGTRATLILCPSNLIAQWEQEIEKFVGTGPLRVLAIRTVAQLKAATVRAIQEVDIVLCSYRVLYSPVYQARLRYFCGGAADAAASAASPGCRCASCCTARGQPAGCFTRRMRPRPPTARQEDLAGLRQRTAQFVRNPKRMAWQGASSESVAQQVDELEYPVLEQFWWNRLVFDEFHELEGFALSQQGSLQFLRGHYRWGLTGTPPTDSVRHVIFMASLFRVDLAGKPADSLRKADTRLVDCEERRPFREPIWRKEVRRAELALRRRRCRYCKGFSGSMWNFLEPTTACWRKACPACGHSWAVQQRHPPFFYGMDYSDSEDSDPHGPALQAPGPGEADASPGERARCCGNPACALCRASAELPALVEVLGESEAFRGCGGAVGGLGDGLDNSDDDDYLLGDEYLGVDVFASFLLLAGQHLEFVAPPEVAAGGGGSSSSSSSSAAQFDTDGPSIGLSHSWELDPVLVRNAQAFVDAMVRQNTASVPIRLEQHFVPIRQTPEERVIYLQQARDSTSLLDDWEADCGGTPEDAQGEEAPPDRQEVKARLRRSQRLLALCSHFSPRARSDGSASQECQRLQGRLERRIAAARGRLERAVCTAELLRRAGAPAPAAAAEAFEASVQALSAEPSLRQIADFAQAAAADAAAATAQALFARAVPSELRSRQAPDPSPRLTAALRAFAARPGAPEDGPSRAAQRLAAEAQEGALEEVWAAVQRSLAEVREATVSLSFFATTLRILSSDARARSCSVCMSEGLPVQRLAITPCSHVYCVPCLKASLAHHQHCPLCRAPVRLQDVQPLALELNGEGASADECLAAACPRANAHFSKYGSKLSVVASTLKDILAGDPAAKVVVFVQWQDLQLCVRNALVEFGIPCAVLQGNVYSRTSTISRFQHGAPSRASAEEPAEDGVRSGGGECGGDLRVLLLSLESSASGVSLTAANHVFFIHPMNAISEAQAVSYELQAVGRVRRWGQARDCVHVWRFVTLDTVEVALTQRHQQGTWQAFREQAQATAAAAAAGGGAPVRGGEAAGWPRPGRRRRSKGPCNAPSGGV